MKFIEDIYFNYVQLLFKLTLSQLLSCYPDGYHLLSGRIVGYQKNRPDSRITGYEPDIRCDHNRNQSYTIIEILMADLIFAQTSRLETVIYFIPGQSLKNNISWLKLKLKPQGRTKSCFPHKIIVYTSTVRVGSRLKAPGKKPLDKSNRTISPQSKSHLGQKPPEIKCPRYKKTPKTKSL